ncbi:unnamed protein product [Parajaminaea phylloscopi]
MGYLEAIVIVLYTDPLKPDDVAESWQFNVGDACPTAKKSRSSYTVRQIKRQCLVSSCARGGSLATQWLPHLMLFAAQDTLRTLQTYVQALQGLPYDSALFLSMKLMYNDRCPLNYEPPGFVEPETGHRFCFATSTRREEPDGVKFSALTTPQHMVNVALITLPSAAYQSRSGIQFLWDAENSDVARSDKGADKETEEASASQGSGSSARPLRKIQVLPQTLLAVCPVDTHHPASNAGNGVASGGNLTMVERFHCRTPKRVGRASQALDGHLFSPPFRSSESTCVDSRDGEEDSGDLEGYSTPLERVPDAECASGEAQAIEALQAMQLDHGTPVHYRHGFADGAAPHGLHKPTSASHLTCECGCADFERGETTCCSTCLKEIHAHCYGYSVAASMVSQLQIQCWSCAADEVERLNDRPVDTQAWVDKLRLLAATRRMLYKLNRRRAWPAGGIQGAVTACGIPSRHGQTIVDALHKEGYFRPAPKKRCKASETYSIVTAAKVRRKMLSEYFTAGAGKEAEIHAEYGMSLTQSQIEDYEPTVKTSQHTQDSVEDSSFDVVMQTRVDQLGRGSSMSSGLQTTAADAQESAGQSAVFPRNQIEDEVNDDDGDNNCSGRKRSRGGEGPMDSALSRRPTQRRRSCSLSQERVVVDRAKVKNAALA